MFSHNLAEASERHGAIWRNYQILYHLNDFFAGVLFVVGSVLFFSEETTFAATVLFLIGSIMFTVRPMIQVLRDFHLTRL
jgi:hypothetical protein